MVTIIIVVYKSDKKKLLNILKKVPDKFHVIIVDNSLDYDFTKIKLSKKTQIIRSKNIGNGGGINLAVKKCKTKFAIYMDIDIKLDSNFLIKFFNISKKIRNFGILIPNHGNFQKKNSILESYEGEAAVMFYNIQNLKKLNFFDEKFFLYFEETDLLHRCKINKVKCYLIQNLKIKHNRASSIKNENYDLKCLRIWHYMWSMFYFYKKNFNYIYAVKKTYIFLIKDFIILLTTILTFNFKNAKIRFYRLYGLISSMICLKSFLRP